MNVTAAILAGGLGTRLRSVVADRPKVLAPVGGRPYLAYLLDQLAGVSVRNVVLLTGYAADQVHDAFGDTYKAMKLSYSVERAPLGTAGALRHALPHFQSPSILVLNGDSYCAADLAAFRWLHDARASEASLVLARVPDATRFGQVCVSRDGRVLHFEEKGTTNGPGRINAGIYLLNRALIEELPTAPASLERDLLPAWVARRRVYGFRHDGRFLDIGTPESYAESEEFFGVASASPYRHRTPGRQALTAAR